MVWVDARPRNAAFGFRWKFSALGRRIVAAMLVATLVLSLLITCAQVLAHRNNEVVQTSQEILNLTLLASQSSDGAVDLAALQERVRALPMVSNAYTTTKRPSLQPSSHRYVLPLGDPSTSRWLVVHVSPVSFWALYQQKGRQSLLSNMLIVLICGMVMMIIFDRLAAMHLKRISAQVASANWMMSGSPISLEADPPVFPNEITAIVDTLETMRRQALDAFETAAAQAATTCALNANLEDLSREQAELSYALSHDLVTPLNSLEMLLVEVGVFAPSISADALQTLCDLQISARRIRGQITSVQSYANLLKGDIDLHPVDLDKVLSQVIRSLQAQIDAIQADIKVERLGTVEGSETWLFELFTQVLTNALLYRDSARDLTVHIRRTDQSDDQTVCIAITDTGLGIDQVHQERVFGLFRRLHTQEDIPGHGMGLPLSRRIVQRHHGEIALTSTPGAGTTVAMSFPRRTL